MRNVIYNTEFEKVIQFAETKDLFLGSGNPNGDVLIIGKEAAIDLSKSSAQHNREITNNADDWKFNYKNKLQFSDVDNWFSNDCTPNYNPLYPYKGQRNIVESKNSDGKIIRGEFGTSRTWYNYQKIIDSLYNNNSKSDNINYHENAFITELNQVTGSYSKEITKKLKKDSIDKRKELFQQPFFDGFPIIIVAAGHYVRDFDINLQELFEVKFDDDNSKKLSNGLVNEYINIHYDQFENPTKILLHTNQLSMVSNDLIIKLGKVCSDFLKSIK